MVAISSSAVNKSECLRMVNQNKKIDFLDLICRVTIVMGVRTHVMVLIMVWR
jgi:hypothetical protein